MPRNDVTSFIYHQEASVNGINRRIINQESQDYGKLTMEDIIFTRRDQDDFMKKLLHFEEGY